MQAFINKCTNWKVLKHISDVTTDAILLTLRSNHMIVTLHCCCLWGNSTPDGAYHFHRGLCLKVTCVSIFYK